MSVIIVKVTVTVADEFGNGVTELTTTQRASEGNPRFFAQEADKLGRRCTSSVKSMIETEYGKVPE